MGTTDTMDDLLEEEADNITSAIDPDTGKLSEDIKVDEKTKKNIEEAVAEAKEDDTIEVELVVVQVAVPIEKEEVEDVTAPTAIETQLNSEANSTEGAENQGVVQYLDLSVLVKAVTTYKNDDEKVTQETLGKLEETSQKMEFTITVPDEYLKPGYEVFVLRHHEGQVEKLELRHVEGNVYSFETDKFSTYALAYVTTHVHTETVINAVAADCGNDGYTGDVVCSTCNTTLQEGSVISADGNHHWSEWKNQEGIAYTFRECWGCGASEYLNASADAPAAGSVISTPATGDTSNVFAWVSLMVACCGVVLGTMVYRKNR